MTDRFTFIRDYICRERDVRIEKMQSIHRKPKLVETRQLIGYFARKYTSMSLAAIGREIGGKNHASVIHGRKKINDLMDVDKEYEKYVSKLDNIIKLNISQIEDRKEQIPNGTNPEKINFIYKEAQQSLDYAINEVKKDNVMEGFRKYEICQRLENKKRELKEVYDD